MPIIKNESSIMNEKLRLISQLFELELRREPNRPDHWFGEQFDRWYETPTSRLARTLEISKLRRPTLAIINRS